MRRYCSVLLLMYALVAACGSSGGGGDSGGGERTPTRRSGTRTPSRTPGGPTRTPAATATPGPAQVLYVRAAGSDMNSGTSPDQALRSVTRAIQRLRPKTTVYVGPGQYTGDDTGRFAITGVAGSQTAPIALLADPDGTHTGDRPGAVVLDGGGDVVALNITRSPYVTIDGFFITGTQPQVDPMPISATAVQVRSESVHVTISNCVIANGTTADGIRVANSSDVLLFNNLIFANDRGIIISGETDNARVINNTVLSSERTGILVTQNDGLAPTGVTILNNIIQENGNLLAINVGEGPPSSLSGYTGDFNLVFEPDAEDQTLSYRPASIRGEHDVNADALFENLPQGDARLMEGSPAVDQGTGQIDEVLLDTLLQRSTSVDGGRDQPPVDMGYHYPR